MKTANKLTITLSPEEVKQAIEYYVWDHKGAGWANVTFNVTLNVAMQSGALGRDCPTFTGATVEVT